MSVRLHDRTTYGPSWPTVLLLLALAVALSITSKPGADQPTTSPDPMTTTESENKP